MKYTLIEENKIEIVDKLKYYEGLGRLTANNQYLIIAVNNLINSKNKKVIFYLNSCDYEVSTEELENEFYINLNSDKSISYLKDLLQRHNTVILGQTDEDLVYLIENIRKYLSFTKSIKSQ